MLRQVHRSGQGFLLPVPPAFERSRIVPPPVLLIHGTVPEQSPVPHEETGRSLPKSDD